MSTPPAVAIESYERVIRAASAPDYARDAKGQLSATFKLGQTTITTDNTRDTLLFLAGSAFEDGGSGTVRENLARHLRSGRSMVRRCFTSLEGQNGAGTATASLDTRHADFQAGWGRCAACRRTKTAPASRSNWWPGVRAPPAGPRKLGLIRSLSNVATEGDLGKTALGGVASTLAAALRDKEVEASADDYIGLAKLTRYERLGVPADPSLDAALALLELREQIQQENGFTLTSMDGKTYSLGGLKGRIVLLNFWATWCPPCRKEMPDMERLYRTYEKQGLTIIAVSDEDRATVEQFLAKNSYSFPVALDPGREVNTSFSVDGIPKSFIFDREGRLAAQAIDMRTESQFMELLKLAGLE